MADLAEVDPLDDRIARRMQLEFHDQAVEVEAEVAAQLAAERNLVEALVEWGQAGFEVGLDGPGWSVVGRVIHGGGDVVRVRTSAKDVDIAAWAIDSAQPRTAHRSPRAVSGGHPRSFLARCRELAAQEAAVIVRIGGRDAEGTILAVAGDHLLLANPERVLRLGAISWVAEA